MGWITKTVRAILRPQLIIVFIASFSIASGLAGQGYRSSSVSAAVSRLAPTVAAAETSSISPDTGIKLSPKPLTFSTDCTFMPCLALTFDDGPDPATTPVIVDVLEKAGAKATFFMIGNRIAGHEAILQRIQADGFDIGNHSWSHPDFTKLTPNQMLDQINKTQTALQAAGVPPATLFRPPYGANNASVRQTLPMPIILWNVDPKDWAEKDPHHLADIVVSQAKPGAIIIMHDSKSTTAAAVGEIVNRLRQNYQLVTISELVALPPDAHGDTVIF